MEGRTKLQSSTDTFQSMIEVHYRVTTRNSCSSSTHRSSSHSPHRNCATSFICKHEHALFSIFGEGAIVTGPVAFPCDKENQLATLHTLDTALSLTNFRCFVKNWNIRKTNSHCHTQASDSTEEKDSIGPIAVLSSQMWKPKSSVSSGWKVRARRRPEITPTGSSPLFAATLAPTLSDSKRGARMNTPGKDRDSRVHQ